MAKEFLLVDGYNIIHAWSELRELVEDVSLESARQRLMDILSNYKGTKQANGHSGVRWLSGQGEYRYRL